MTLKDLSKIGVKFLYSNNGNKHIDCKTISANSISLDSCKTLNDLKEYLRNFDGLDFKKSATNMVFSDGDQYSKVMLVGEAPGAEEDVQAKPFVGNSGKLLNNIFKSIGLERENIYITNIIPYRPPLNRTPTEAEINMFKPMIKKHIELVKPDIIVCLGSVPAKAIIESSQPIGKIRGMIQKITINSFDTHVMATFHPSYLLRSPMQKALVWQDMLNLRIFLDKQIK